LTKIILRDRNSEIDSDRILNNLSFRIEESLTRTEEYRYKIKNYFNDKLSNKENENISNDILYNQSIEFAQKDKIKKEFYGKSNEKYLANSISNSIMNKSDG
jgi:hypothetical protein